MKKLAFYIRVSTKHQSEKFGLQAQIDALNEYAKKEKATVVKVYQDIMSGAKGDRPGLNQMLMDAKEGVFDSLIFVDLDRLGRSMGQIFKTAEILDELGIEYGELRGLLRIDDKMTRKLMLAFLAWAAEWERRQNIERSIRGRLGKLAKGEINSQRKARFPFRFSDDKKDIEIDPVGLKIYHLMIQLKLEKLFSDKKIAERLNSLPLEKRGRERWFGHRVSSALKDRSLVEGYFTIRQKGVNGEVVLEHRVEFEPLISKSVFDKIQKVYKNNLVSTPGKSQRVYLLSRLMKCVKCGNTLQIYNNNQKVYYRCRGRKEGTCNLPYFPLEKADKLIMKVLQTSLSSEEKLRAAIVGKEEQLDLEKLAAEEQHLNKEELKVSRQLKKILDEHLEGYFPQEMLKEKSQALNKQLQTIAELREELDTKKSVALQKKETWDNIKKQRDYLLKKLENSSMADKRRLLRQLLGAEGKILVTYAEDEKQGKFWFVRIRGIIFSVFTHFSQGKKNHPLLSPPRYLHLDP